MHHNDLVATDGFTFVNGGRSTIMTMRTGFWQQLIQNF
jgi:hypothetical protein